MAQNTNLNHLDNIKQKQSHINSKYSTTAVNSSYQSGRDSLIERQPSPNQKSKKPSCFNKIYQGQTNTIGSVVPFFKSRPLINFKI